jgi:ATP-dependent DNA helicase RecQ
MTIHLNVLGAAEAAPVEFDQERAPPAIDVYHRSTLVAANFSKMAIGVKREAGFLAAVTQDQDLALAGDERSFLIASIVVPARQGLTTVFSPSLDSIKRAKKTLEGFGLRVASFELAPSKIEKRRVWEKLDACEIDVLLVSPGRLASIRFRERLSRRDINHVSFLNAHLLSPWSHRFNPSYRQICGFVKTLQYSVCSVHIWSVDKNLHQDVHRTIGLREPFCDSIVSREIVTPTVTGVDVKADDQRLEVMSDFAADLSGQGVFYVGSVKQLFDTKIWLESLGESPGIIKPGLDEFSVQKIRSSFEQGTIRLVVSQSPFLSTLEKAPGLQFVVFNGLPDSVEYLGQETFAHETAASLSCLCLSSENDFFHHRFAIDKSYPDSLTLRACFQGVKDFIGRCQFAPPDALLSHIKVATPFSELDIKTCVDAMQREGLIEIISDPITEKVSYKLSADGLAEVNFWHEYPLRKLEQIHRLERTRSFLTSPGDLGKQLREKLNV